VGKGILLVSEMISEYNLAFGYAYSIQL